MYIEEHLIPTFFRVWSRSIDQLSDYSYRPGVGVCEWRLPHVRDFHTSEECDKWLDKHGSEFPTGTHFIIRELTMDAIPHFVE